jgi:hypothetical protein
MPRDDLSLRPILSEPQSRALSVGVRRLWGTLDQLDQLLTAPPGDDFHEVDFDIAAADVHALRNEIEDVRCNLRRLAYWLRITPDRRSTRAMFAALASSAWTTAEDLHPNKLRGYGAMDPDTARVLAPLIEPIAAGLLGLAARTNHPRAESTAPPPSADERTTAGQPEAEP